MLHICGLDASFELHIYTQLGFLHSLYEGRLKRFHTFFPQLHLF